MPSPELAAPAEHRQNLAAYRLGPGDKLKITVFGHPQESGDFEIDGLGFVAYPLLGRIEAKGRTVSELTDHLRVELNRTFIVDPRVSVEVLNYRPFYIYGEVNRAGSYPFVSGLTVRRAVAIAGGFSRRARYAPVTLVREGREGVIKYEAQLEVPVLPGTSSRWNGGCSEPRCSDFSPHAAPRQDDACQGDRIRQRNRKGGVYIVS